MPAPTAHSADTPTDGPDPVSRRVNTVTHDVGGVGEQVRVLVLRRTLAASPGEVWAALGDAEVVAGWPGSPAGGLLESVAPERWATTWEHAGRTGRLDASLRPVPGGTLLQLDHTDPLGPDEWRGEGPAAVGLAWERALADLARRLGGAGDEPDLAPVDPAASAQAWAEAAIADGDDPDQAREAARRASS